MTQNLIVLVSKLYHSLTFSMPFWGYYKMTIFEGGLTIEECVHFMDIYLVKS